MLCFDKEVRFDAADIEPMITYGTNPGMGMAITDHIPTTESMSEVEKASFEKSMHYMGFPSRRTVVGQAGGLCFSWVHAPMGVLRTSVPLPPW